eukprot:TRINITY_DN6646_c0_g3_i1.p13 TRINITY_DN6646_c0_g3~~TRINITY_DN6646_c0_g3_i1.p13  ORF type:complete len:115 (+),score=5.85 TRINITY_DN6646_c0_g3_i1:2937-3281(+)
MRATENKVQRTRLVECKRFWVKQPKVRKKKMPKTLKPSFSITAYIFLKYKCYLEFYETKFAKSQGLQQGNQDEQKREGKVEEEEAKVGVVARGVKSVRKAVVRSELIACPQQTD